MFLFKLLLPLIFVFSIAAQAQEEMPEVKASGNNQTLDLTTIGLSYLSWTEFVDLDNGIIGDRAYANFYGLALSYEREFYYQRRFGNAFDIAVLSGQANAGGSQTAIVYQTSYHQWYGAQATYRWAYRLSPQITLSAGPTALYREIKWPLEGAVTEIKSGSALNLGALFDMRIRMTRQWELRQMIGTLAFKASTIWSIGIGYKF